MTEKSLVYKIIYDEAVERGIVHDAASLLAERCADQIDILVAEFISRIRACPVDSAPSDGGRDPDSDSGLRTRTN